MPGRGQPWKVGGTPDNTITSEDIKQGTIKQEDIDPAYQALIEGGGGGIDSEHVVDPFDNFWFYDEFFYPSPSTGLDVHFEKQATGGISVVDNVEGGQTRIATDGVVDDVARVNICGTGRLAFDPDKNARLVWRTSKLISGDTLQSYLIGAYHAQGTFPGGLFPFTTGISTSYLWFRSDGTGNWFAETYDQTTLNSVDTGVADDALFHTFEIRTNPSTPSIEFLIDDVVEATFTTDLPTFSLNAIATVQSNEATNKFLVIDSLFIYQDR